MVRRALQGKNPNGTDPYRVTAIQVVTNISKISFPRTLLRPKEDN